MLQIRCPFCGIRDETEFEFGGEAGRQRPDGSASDSEWSQYLFMRSNAKGIQRERWFHRYGCGQWFEVERDTATHEVIGVFKMGASVAEARV